MPALRMNEELRQKAVDAITDRDSDHLRDCLEQLVTEHSTQSYACGDRGPAVVIPQSDPPVCSLLEYSVQEDFLSGVWMLLQHSRFRPGPEDVLKAFVYSMRHDNLAIVRFFLEMALVRVDEGSRWRDASAGDCDGNDGGTHFVRDERAFATDSEECMRYERVMIPLFDVLQFATTKKMYDIAARVILTSDFDVNAEGNRGTHRPLTIVVDGQQPQLVDILLHRGAVVDAPDNAGMTALMVAGAVASVDCLRVLLQHGADANHSAPHSNVATPLKSLYFSSTRSRHFFSLVNLLLQAGLDVSRERWLGRVPRSSMIRGTDLACHDRLVEMSSCPLSLKMSCLGRIRRRLSDVQRGASIIHSVYCLPLPVTLKYFLLLDYCEMSLDNPQMSRQ